MYLLNARQESDIVRWHDYIISIYLIVSCCVIIVLTWKRNGNNGLIVATTSGSLLAIRC